MHWRDAGYCVGGCLAELLARGVATAHWEVRSDPLARVRDVCISLLRDVMSERGVQQRPLNATLSELQRICDTLAHHHQPAAQELSALIWRLHCSLSQLEQAPPPGTLGN